MKKNEMKREFIGSEMTTQCHYCKYDRSKCSILNTLFSKRNGYVLCPERVDVFKIEISEDYRDRLYHLMRQNDIDKQREWVEPYGRDLVISLNSYEPLYVVVFDVVYGEDFIRNDEGQLFIEELTELIEGVLYDTISQTSIKDTLCGH